MCHEEQQEAISLLSKHANLRFLKEIVEQGVPSIAARNPTHPPSHAGLLGIAAYTSGRLDQKIRQLHEPHTALPCEMGKLDCPQDIQKLEQLVKSTIPLIQKTPRNTVRRNMNLNFSAVDRIKATGTLTFDRIASVTQDERQVYSIGNADLILELKTGVVDVSALSTYSNDKFRNEKEGMLDPGTRFELVRITPGKEKTSAVFHQGTDFPPITLLLREISPYQ